MTISRKTERRRAIRNTSLVAGLLSLLCHLLLLALLVPQWLERLDGEPLERPEPDQELEIEAVYEKIEVPKTDPSEAVEEATTDPQPVQLSAEISDAASENSMMVASAELPEKPEPPEQREPPPAPEEPAVQEVEQSEPAPIEEQSPVILRKPKPTPRNLLMPDAATYEQMFATRDVEAEERAKQNGRGKVLFENYEKTKEGIRTSLKSFGHDVKPGNHTGVDPHSNAFGSYIGAIHRKIHVRWAHGYLMDLDLHEPAGSPMNDPTLNTKLELVIRAEDGELEAVNIVSSSGQVRFDAQAIAIVYSTGPHPNPPPEIVSPNGKVYVHWNFWRDQRQCGVFGASIYIVGEQGSPG